MTAIVAAIGLCGCGSSAPNEEPNEMTLHHLLHTRIKGLDPGDMRDVYSIMVGSQIFETLYDYHFLKRPYELIPLLAEDMPEVDPDQLVWTIKIKRGVYFRDDVCFPGGKGRELKAQDFIFSIQRIANIKYLSPNWSLFDERIVGLDEFREYTKSCKSEAQVDYSRTVEGLTASDDWTFVIRLTKPWPQLISAALADISTSPVAKEAVDYYGKDIISHPIGTGPFKLNVWRRGSYIELGRNPTFRGELYPSEGESTDAEAGYLDDAGKSIPFADKVVWTVIEEYQPAWLLFLQGKVDATVIGKDNYGEVMTEGGQLAAKMKQANIQLKTFPDPSTYWLGFNMADSTLGNNKPLRLAISRAIDRQKFIELFFNGRHLVADGLIPPMMACYDPQIKQKGYARYDPQEAQKLLKEAEAVFLRQAQDGERFDRPERLTVEGQSRTNGTELPTLKIAMPGTDTWTRQFGQFLERSLNAVGLEVDIQYMDLPTYQEKLNTKSAQMFASGTTAGTPDALDFLSMFYSRNASPGPNKFNYSNPEFDRLYEKAEVMADSPERDELYRRMETIVLEDCPAAFLNHRVGYVLHHGWYKNYKPHAFAYGLSKYRRIDMAERSADKELLKKIK
jgi:oligopeptide transport system substrate-binding protein